MSFSGYGSTLGSVAVQLDYFGGGGDVIDLQDFAGRADHADVHRVAGPAEQDPGVRAAVLR